MFVLLSSDYSPRYKQDILRGRVAHISSCREQYILFGKRNWRVPHFSRSLREVGLFDVHPSQSRFPCSFVTDVAQIPTYDSRVPKGLKPIGGGGAVSEHMLLGKPGRSW